MKRIVFIWALFFLFIGSGDILCAGDDSWQNTFESICVHTADAGNLSSEKLGRLIDESDALLKIIESSDDPDKKFYLIRLKKCRNFFVFMKSIAKDPESK